MSISSFKTRKINTTHSVITTAILVMLTVLWLVFLSTSTLAEPVITKTVNLSQYGIPASMDINPQTRQIIIAFRSCQVLFLKSNLEVEQTLQYPGCKVLFGSRFNTFQGQLVVASALYSGKSAIYDFRNSYLIATHTAAVTDALIANNYLLTSSDDGSLAVSRLDSLSQSEPKTRKLLESIGVARKLAMYPETGQPVTQVALSHDTGEIAVVRTKSENWPQAPRPKIYRPIKSRINTMRFTFDGADLIVGYFTGELVKLNLATGKTTILYRSREWLNTIDTFLPNRLVTGDDQGLVNIFDYRNNKTLMSYLLSAQGINAVRFLDRQTVLAIDAAGMLYQSQIDLP